MRSVTAYYILIAGCALCPAQDSSAQDNVMLQADQAFVQAVQRADGAAMDRLLDNGFTWTDFEGKTSTKAGIIKNVPKMSTQGSDHASPAAYIYANLGDVQENYGHMHVLRVWVKRPAGWKAIIYQEVRSLDAPPSFAPGAGIDCENPCKTIPYRPKNATEREVVAAYSKLETAATARNSAVFGTLVADEFVAVSSNSDKISNKRGRMRDFDHSKNAGVAPTPLLSARMFDFGDAVLMTSKHQPDRGRPLYVTRIWVKRNGTWVETLSYQTSIQAAAAP
jgi:hypothetical protein